MIAELPNKKIRPQFLLFFIIDTASTNNAMITVAWNFQGFVEVEVSTDSNVTM